MRSSDALKLSMDNLSHRGLRSWLTILGIVIGVAAVVTILAIGAGTQQSISSQLGGLGADVLSLSAGSGRAGAFGGFQGAGAIESGFQRRQSSAAAVQKNLTTTDLMVIKAVPGVKTANGIVSGRENIAYMSQTTSASVQGIDPVAWVEISSPTLSSGRFLSSSDTNAIVVGYGIANNVFKKTVSLNSQVTINGTAFKVVGILAQSGGFSGTDNAVYMTVNAARTVVSDVLLNQYSSIQIKVADVNAINETQSLMEQRLFMSRHVTNSTKDFTITSSQSMQETISTVMSTLNLFLTGIAATSLLVGAVGIANTMFMSVLERTRLIGTLKALGATNGEIMRLFLFESAIIGLVGGLIGVFLGFILCGAISELGVRLMGITTGGSTTIAIITPELVAFAVGFSMIVGILSGIFPARSAAKLQPVEALRFE